MQLWPPPSFDAMDLDGRGFRPAESADGGRASAVTATDEAGPLHYRPAITAYMCDWHAPRRRLGHRHACAALSHHPSPTMATLIRPVSGDVDRLRREMDTLFQSFMPVRRRRGAASGLRAPTSSKREDSYHVDLDLPGVDRDSLELTLDDGVLKINGERALREAHHGRPLPPRRAQLRPLLALVPPRAGRRLGHGRGVVRRRRALGHGPQGRAGQAAPHRGPLRRLGAGRLGRRSESRRRTTSR